MDAPRQNILFSSAHVRLIEGEPGAGKTWFGCQLANRELIETIPFHQKVLFLTFARNAVSRIREAYLTQFPDIKNYERLRIDTFAGFFWWMVESYGRYSLNGILKRLWLCGSIKINGIIIPEGYEGVTFDAIEEKALELTQIKAIQILLSKIDPLIIVDESQDMSDRLSQIIINLAQKSRIVLLRGPGQCIYRNIYNFDPSSILQKIRTELNPEEHQLPFLDRTRQRYSADIENYLNQVKTKTVAPATDYPIKFKKVALRNTQGNPNRLDTFVALELKELKRHLRAIHQNGQRLSYGVLTSTNTAVAEIYSKIINGSDGYRLSPQSASILFGDNIFLQYGRLLFRLLQYHRFAHVANKMSEDQIAGAVVMLFREYDPSGNYNISDWKEFSRLLISKIENMRTLNIDTINGLLRATRSNLPDGCPSTPFDRTDKPLLDLMYAMLNDTMKLYIFDKFIRLPEAEAAFEKENQKKIIFEKLGIQKNVQVMTIHKAKGKEFDGVILVLENSRKALWSRNNLNHDEIKDLYWVAISRAKKAISIVGYEDSYSKASMPVKDILPQDLFS